MVSHRSSDPYCTPGLWRDELISRDQLGSNLVNYRPPHGYKPHLLVKIIIFALSSEGLGYLSSDVGQHTQLVSVFGGRRSMILTPDNDKAHSCLAWSRNRNPLPISDSGFPRKTF